MPTEAKFITQRVVLKFEDDEKTGAEKAYVALDSASGGYPTAATSVIDAHDFKSVHKAREYAAHFTTYPLKIRKDPYVISIFVHEYQAS
jgi:hypothetical protein